MRSRLSQPLQQIYRTLTAYRRLVLLMAIVGIVLAQQAHGQTALAIDTAVSTDRSTSATTIATPAFSTHATNELLLAFVSADDVSAGNTVTGVSGGGLTWQLVARTNVQRGTAEVWRAFSAAVLANVTVTATTAQSVAGSITVVTFTGADTTGTNGSGAIGATRSASAASGAPSGSVVTTRNGSWVFGVGTDWDSATNRTVGANQTIVHQYLATIGDTYWAQRTTNPTATSGTAVTINDTAPTADQYNLTLVEVLPNLVADTTPPTVSVTAPANGATVNGAAVSVTATASDNVGVVGVQFKLDGANLGAEATASPYTISWNTTTTGNGSHALTAVARDAAGNTTTSTAVNVTVNNDTTPPTVSITAPANGAIVSGTAVAITASASDNVGVAGVQFKLDGANIGAEVTTAPYTIAWNSTMTADGAHALTAVARDAAGNTATSTAVNVTVRNDTTPPTVTISAPAAGATVSGTAVSITATATDNVGVVGVQFKLDGANLGAEDTAAPYTISWNTTATGNGAHALTAVARDAAGNSATSAAVNVTVNNDTTPPTVTTTAPVNGATFVPPGAPITVTFSEAVAAASVTTSSVFVQTGGTPVAATVNTNGAVVTLTPSAALAGSTTYTATVKGGAGGVTDLAGNPLAADVTWSFTTSSCPCSIWTMSTTPGPMAADGSSVELGLKVRSDSAGFITGLRFYKYATNTGTHVGSVWAMDGTLLGSVTFANETASGWQQATLPTPVAVTAGTTYIASYHAPVGNYAITTSGLTAGVDTPPLHAVADGVNGGNGVYVYGATSAMPTNSFQASNYWVDVVFSTSGDPVPPTVSIASPTAGSTVGGSAVAVSATASDNVGVVGVQFKVDGANLGAELTAPPYTTTWNTTTVANGSHGLTAVARDAAGNSTTSTAVNVTVANDSTPPTVTATAPANSATGVSPAAAVTVTFSEAMSAASVTATSVFLQTGGTTVAATLATNGAVVTLTPSAPLSGSTTYTATVKGGSNGVKDVSGNPLAADVTWSFTTLGCPCSIWTMSTTPGPVAVDANSVEVGVKFQSDVSGFITGLRFYKYAANTGTHVGSLWAQDGTLLGSVTFANETPSGWQQATLQTPVAVTAGTTYIASYHAPVGNYAITTSGLTAGVNTPPLHAVADGVNGGNGVFLYSGTSVMPTSSFQGSNYWVDVVFTLIADGTPPTVAITAPASGATVAGTAVPVSANATDNVAVAGVQFKLDGVNLGAEVTAPPYAIAWNTIASVNGPHVLTAIARDGAGNTATTSGLSVTVNNDVTAPTVTLTAPASGATVSGNTVTVSATATDNVGVVGVQFKLDGGNLGAEVTTAPYTMTWNTLTASNGTHTLSAVARDAAGNSTSMTISVTVSNVSTLSIDAVAFGDRSSANTVVTTAAFSTSAANEVLLAFVGAAADSSSPNTTVTGISGAGLTWTLALRTNTQRGTAEVWRALAATALTNVTVTASLSQGAASSLTVVSFKGADTSGTNASGAIGATRSANANPGAPTATLTTTRNGSWVIGVGNDWDDAIARTMGGSQTMVHQLVSTGTGDTFWTQRMTSASGPSGTAVTINDTAPATDRYNLSVVEVLASVAGDTTPPTVTLTAPASGATVSGAAVALAATASDNVGVAGVQFKVDGANVGAESTTPPYGATWDSRGVVNGGHTVSAVARDAAGNTSISSVVVTVTNETTPPTVSITAPAPGATVSGTAVTVSATASDNVGVVGVQFRLDGVNFGAEVTAAPYAVTWNTTTTANGVHVLSAVARDAAGNTGTSANVLVTVSNTLVLSVASKAPAAGAANASIASIMTATFNTAVDPSTINGSTIQLRNSSNALVTATVWYDAPSLSAILAPASALATSSTYTATVTTGVKDASGNALGATVTWSFTTAAPISSPTTGAGGPILVVSNSANSFTQYYAEILRSEGLNEFAVADLSTVTASVLAGYDVVVLGEQTLTSAQVTMLTTWVQNGGNLVALRPDKKLTTLLGLSDQAATLSDGYVLMDSTQPSAAGLVNQTIQFHGAADEYLPAPATVIATLYSTAAVSTPFPAVTLNAVGAGQAAAFTFDLAKSVVYTRQGNPAWAGQERDGVAPIRSDDLFFGAKSGDVQPDWIDLSKVAIPQADEQQRLRANLILTMNSSRRPLPRLWYLPNGKRAAVVMTGDDHGNGGTAGRFDHYIAVSPAGCNVANWECVRSTSNIYTNTPITNAQVASYLAQGFEVAAHISMAPNQAAANCGTPSDFTAATLPSFYSTQLANFASLFPSAVPQTTNRMHCLVWSDWFSQPTVEQQNGIRLDTSYYYWPGTWIQDRPGMFTGSGMPMRFASTTGSMADVYQAVTQMTDESSQSYPGTITTLLDNAIGAAAYYGVFTANMHTDTIASTGSDAIVTAAQSRGVPIISAKQLLTWLDGRNGSIFGPIGFGANTLTFSVAPGSGANGLQILVPIKSSTLTLSSITLNSVAVPWTTQTIKGLSYAVVTATPGQYRIRYQ